MTITSSNRTDFDAEGWLHWSGSQWLRRSPVNGRAEEVLVSGAGRVAIGADAMAETAFAAVCIRQLMWLDPSNPFLVLAGSEAAGGHHRLPTFLSERRCAEARFGPLFVSAAQRDADAAPGRRFSSPAARINLPSNASDIRIGLDRDSCVAALRGLSAPSRGEASRGPRPASGASRSWTASSSARRAIGTALALLGAAVAGRLALACMSSGFAQDRLLPASGEDASDEMLL